MDTTEADPKAATDSPTLAESSRTVAEAGSAAVPKACASADIRDHELIRRIGQGSYGEVWLARNVMGTYRAVKIVYRAAFEHARPFEREFNGIQKFEPLSRSHDGFVDILQIGRADEYFYYVMELADDVTAGQQVDPNRYEPKTLRSEVQGKKALPFEQCVELGLSLTHALGKLHEHGLIHRDIKPSNIIFVNGQPKLADIGLVAEQSEAKSFVGTEGFIPPEGPGTPQADIYSLGKVLYQIATGKDRHEFPALPTLLGDSGTDTHLLELNTVFLKACQSDIKQRYQTCEQMRDDLLLLRSGKSVKRAHIIEKRFIRLAYLSVVGVALTTLAFVALAYVKAQERKAVEQAQRETALRKQAEDEREKARRNLYVADMNVVQQALQAGNMGRAADLLDRHRPQSGALDLRGWEWRYFWKQCQSDAFLEFASHSNSVQSLSLSADGRLLAVADVDGVVKLYDFPGRREVLTVQALPPETDEGFGARAAISPDGQYLAFVGWEPRPRANVKLWNLPAKKELTVLHHPGLVKTIAFSGDGKRLATFAQDGLARVWDVESRQIVHTEETGPVFVDGIRGVVAFSADGRYLAIGEMSGRIRLIDLDSGVEAARFEDHKEGITALAFSHDGSMLASSSGYLETDIKLWDLRHHKSSGELKGHRAWVSALLFDRSGQKLISSSADQTIRLWDVSTRRSSKILRGHRTEVWTLALSPDGNTLVSGSKSGQVYTWDLSAQRALEAFTTLPVAVNQVAFSPDNISFATVGNDGSVARWNLATPVNSETLGAIGTNNVGILWTSDGHWLLAGDEQGFIKVWDTETGRITKSFQALDRPVLPWRLIDHGSKFMTLGLEASTPRVWELGTWKEVPALTSEPLWYRAADLSLDQERLAFCRAFGWLDLFNLKTGTEIRIRAHTDTWRSLTYSPNNELLVTSALDGFLKVWGAKDGELRRTLKPHVLTVGAVAFSPDGARLATASARRDYLKLWDTQTWDEVASLEGVGDHAASVVFAADGNSLVSVSENGVAHLWRAPSLKDIDMIDSAKGKP